MLYVRGPVIGRAVSIMVEQILADVLVWIVRLVFSPWTIHGWDYLCRLYNRIN